ncbi:cytochrome c oxidase subunit II [Halosimplex pelagicum]|uniref:Cytochrome c oxidase subunit II n=1 Tax=Halosimplex pelagicum TaxID=869886 RepID=A0A7D5PBS6_9EURY|nr:cytochrome c oxidase subunit II [Halosimplex pelagicum]QLH84024.1 cytochrome c oxidase subunit II [Halosimplex pelagicum]
MSESTRRERSARRIAVATVGLAAASAVALAVAATGGSYDSTTEATRRGLHRTLLAVGLPATILVEGALVYAVVRFSGDSPADPLDERRWPELAWALGVGVVFLLVGVLSYQAMVPAAVGDAAVRGPLSEPGEEARGGGVAGRGGGTGTVVVHVTAEQWDWTFRYPTANRTSERLVLPVDRRAVFRLRSRDVIHGFAVPDLGLKRDAFPGQYTYLRTTPTDTGRFRVVCVEFCGAGHSRMAAPAAVVTRSEFANWTSGDAGQPVHRQPKVSRASHRQPRVSRP